MNSHPNTRDFVATVPTTFFCHQLGSSLLFSIRPKFFQPAGNFLQIDNCNFYVLDAATITTQIVRIVPTVTSSPSANPASRNFNHCSSAYAAGSGARGQSVVPHFVRTRSATLRSDTRPARAPLPSAPRPAGASSPRVGHPLRTLARAPRASLGLLALLAGRAHFFLRFAQLRS